MNYEELVVVYNYCNQYPARFRSVDALRVEGELKDYYNNLGIFKKKEKSTVEEQLNNIEKMVSDYDSRFRNKVTELTYEYTNKGYGLSIADTVVRTLEFCVENKNITNDSYPGILSVFITCHENGIQFSRANDQYYKGDGKLGDMSFNGLASYPKEFDYYSVCGQMALMHTVANELNGKRLSNYNLTLLTDVQEYDPANGVYVSRTWIYSDID